ncbi:MAG: hypothetical protein NC430_03150, partial [bacterium]|nr:hypothetical protein [bacterium]
TDMYAYMTSRVRNYNELINFCKICKELRPINVEIIKEINLRNDELFFFLKDFKRNQNWMFPYVNRMSKIVDGKWQCLLLASDKLKAPIVIYSNMCLYPQYVGILQK